MPLDRRKFLAAGVASIAVSRAPMLSSTYAETAVSGSQDRWSAIWLSRRPDWFAMLRGANEIDDGWNALVCDFLASVERVFETTQPEARLELCVIKEKFGLLTIQYNLHASEEVRNEVARLSGIAWSKSQFICERCGDEGRLGSADNCTICLCAACAREHWSQFDADDPRMRLVESSIQRLYGDGLS